MFPVAPVPPVAPVFPCGPVGPVEPVYPVAPAEPCAPCGPMGPSSIMIGCVEPTLYTFVVNGISTTEMLFTVIAIIAPR